MLAMLIIWPSSFLILNKTEFGQKYPPQTISLLMYEVLLRIVAPVIRVEYWIYQYGELFITQQ